MMRRRGARGGKRRGPRKAPGPFGGVGSWWCAAAFAVMPGGVRGDARGHWAYVLRASLKPQFLSDFRNFEGFMPLAQRQLGR